MTTDLPTPVGERHPQLGQALWGVPHMIGAFQLFRDGNQLILLTTVNGDRHRWTFATPLNVEVARDLTNQLLTFLGQVAP